MKRSCPTLVHDHRSARKKFGVRGPVGDENIRAAGSVRAMASVLTNQQHAPHAEFRCRFQAHPLEPRRVVGTHRGGA